MFYIYQHFIYSHIIYICKNIYNLLHNMKYRIKEICDEKGIKVNSIIGTVGITLPALYNIVNGKMSPKMETLAKIAEALNVPLWQLFVSPEEVRKETSMSGFYVCPKCGAKLDIELKEFKY